MNSIILKPYRISDVDFDKIIYSHVKVGKNKKVVYLNYGDTEHNNKFTFQTTSLLNTEPIKNKEGFSELDIPLFGKTDSKVNELITFLKNLDQKIISDGRKNHKTWFNGLKNITYKSIIRSSTNKDDRFKNGVLRIKITKNSNNNPILINNLGEEIDVDKIEPNSYVKMILECYAVWITESGFGLYIRPILMSFNKIKTFNYKYELLDESDEDLDIIEDVIDTEVNPSTHSAFLQDAINLANNSDEETSQIEYPKKLNIINNIKTSSELKSNLISDLEKKKNTTDEVTSYYNSDDNIQTYKNYTSDNKKKIKCSDTSSENIASEKHHEIVNGVIKQLDLFSKESSDEDFKLNPENEMSQNMLSQISSKISLIDSELNNSSSDDLQIGNLQSLIKNNV